jgi:hypothetical protein
MIALPQQSKSARLSTNADAASKWAGEDMEAILLAW